MAQYRKDTNQYLPTNKTIYEVMMLADVNGTPVYGANPTGMAVDGFGRARTSTPLTLFDSFHRYQDNGRIGTANSATGSTVTHRPNQSCIECTITNAANSYVYRESNRVFSYQPGKSLQILETFVLAPPQVGLRQRYGYFGTQNGFFLEVVDHNVYFVKRSYTTGSVVETRVAQADWNFDPMDGTGPSNLTLDLSKAQILFHDIEWLGVGSCRVGFVIDGALIHCHTWNWANSANANSVYMTTACLPVRAEIENYNSMANTSTMKVICASVISEGGYEARGRQKTVGQEPNSAYTLTNSNTYYPVAAIRLKSDRADGVVIPRNVHLTGSSGGSSLLRYKIVIGTMTDDGNWISAGNDSSVQYTLNANTYNTANGVDAVSGYVSITNQSTGVIDLTRDGGSVFRFQLERNSLANSNNAFIVAVAGQKSGDKAYVSIDWEEPT